MSIRFPLNDEISNPPENFPFAPAPVTYDISFISQSNPMQEKDILMYRHSPVTTIALTSSLRKACS